MKKIARFFLFSLPGFFLSISSLQAHFTPPDTGWQGAWQFIQGDQRYIVQMVDNYCVFVSYNQLAKKFDKTWGGPFEHKDGSIVVKHEFNTEKPELVGTEQSYECRLAGKNMQSAISGAMADWVLIDPAATPLSGVWRINGRKQGEEIAVIQLGERRTLKILTGTRFQWIAFNRQTKEFFGTGGGHYTFENGRYTEHIEFFSRDASRVGASLGFDGRLEKGTWHHSGFSSKGDPIYETWIHLNP